MTKEEFSNLSIDKQDEFLNSGATFLESPVVSDVSTIQEIPKVESENGVILPPDSVKDEVLINSPQPSDSFLNGFDIKDPVELLFFVDPDIISGKDILYDWQIQIMLDYAKGGQSDDFPFQAMVRAANGSGKDKYVVAACVTWSCMRHTFTTGVVTSSSGFQLDNQTCRHIKYLCECVNRKFGSEIWNCKYRNYRCNFGAGILSEIFCYATDEAGKAEGFHPIRSSAKLVIFLSEDKTIPDEINVAVNKYTGYTHRVHVSSPGMRLGHFFDLCNAAIDRAAIKDVTDVKPGDFIHYKITGYMCPHIKPFYIEQMKRDLPGGELGAAFQSQVMAEFGSADGEMVVIPHSHVWSSLRADILYIPEPHNKAGLDLSLGGDETVLVVRNGNKVLKIIPFKFDDSEDTIEFLNDKFKEWHLTHKEAYIFADCGGIGSPMLDRMKRQGWSNIRYRDNRAKTTRPKVYKNYNAQSWFDFANLIAHQEIILIDDPITTKQLTTRYYKLVEGVVHQLLSKIEQKAKKFPSPDRADAHVLAFSDYKSTYISPNDKEENRPTLEETKEKEQKTVGDLTLKGHARGFNNFNPSKYITDKQKDLTDVKAEIEQYNKRLQLTKN